MKIVNRTYLRRTLGGSVVHDAALLLHSGDLCDHAPRSAGTGSGSAAPAPAASPVRRQQRGQVGPGASSTVMRVSRAGRRVGGVQLDARDDAQLGQVGAGSTASAGARRRPASRARAPPATCGRRRGTPPAGAGSPRAAGGSRRSSACSGCRASRPRRRRAPRRARRTARRSRAPSSSATSCAVKQRIGAIQSDIVRIIS